MCLLQAIIGVQVCQRRKDGCVPQCHNFRFVISGVGAQFFTFRGSQPSHIWEATRLQMCACVEHKKQSRRRRFSAPGCMLCTPTNGAQKQHGLRAICFWQFLAKSFRPTWIPQLDLTHRKTMTPVKCGIIKLQKELSASRSDIRSRQARRGNGRRCSGRIFKTSLTCE